MSRITYGARGLERAVRDYRDEVEKRVKQIVVETAQLIKAEVQTRMPVDSGELRDSITLKISDGGLSASIHIGAEHAIYVNYGTGIYAEGPGGSRAKKIPWTYWSPKLNRFVRTSGMRAQEFWEPAIEIGERHFIREMGRL